MKLAELATRVKNPVVTKTGVEFDCPKHGEGAAAVTRSKTGGLAFSCLGGCSAEELIESLGLDFESVLETDTDSGPGSNSRPTPQAAESGRGSPAPRSRQEQPETPPNPSRGKSEQRQPPSTPPPQTKSLESALGGVPAADILRRIPPHNIEAEESVLGALFIDHEMFHQVLKVMGPADFYRESHRLIWRGVADLIQAGKTPIDAVTLCAELKQHEVLEQVGGPQRIAELATAVPVAANAPYYAEIVHQMAIKRSVASTATEIAALAYNGVSADALLGEADRLLTPLLTGAGLSSRKDLPMPQSSSCWLSEEKERFAMTTFIWDGILEPGAIALIGGKKGHGKSTFARTLALKIARGEECMGRSTVRSRVWYIDLEPGGRGRMDVWRQLGWSDEDPLDMSTIPPVAGNPEALAWLRKYIEQNDYGVVFIDTMFKFLKIDGTNDYDKGLYAQVPLEQICRDTGVCIVLLHHSRKNSGLSSNQTVAEQLLGATSIAGAACACMGISHRGDTYTFRMDPPRYGEGIEGEIVLGRDEQGFVQPHGSWKKQWVNMTKGVVMDAARDFEDWFQPSDLMVTNPEDGQPLSKRSRDWAINALVKDNLLEKGNPIKSGKKGKPAYLYRVIKLRHDQESETDDS